MEGNLQYNATTSGTKYYNIAKDLAALNSKNEEISSRDGHVMGYMVNVSAFSTGNGLLTLATIPNTWRVRNAFRKFHFAREHMFTQAGVTKSERGKYGHTMRPYFSLDHRNDGDQTPRILDIAGTTASPALADMTGGEWTYTQLASQPTLDEGQLAKDLDLALVDKWDIHVLGGSLASDTASTVSTWDSVGMVVAYNKDRMDMIPDADATNYPGSTISKNNNPLAALRSQNLGTGEVLEIAKDQEEEKAPYEITDDGDSTDAVIAKMTYMSSSAEAAFRNLGTIFVPAGLLCVQSTAANINGLVLTVVGKVLCKDLA
jgi:hypothetical protein